MILDLGRILGRTFLICWRHRWLWLLGVFGGGGGLGLGLRGGVTYAPTPARITTFVQDYALWLGVAVVVVLLLLIVGFAVTCIAVPASIWAGLMLDAGMPATLRQAWGEGVRRFWVYLRLYLLRFLINLALLLALGLLVTGGVALYGAVGRSRLVLLILVGVVLLIVLFATYIVITFLLSWSERVVLILGVGALEALRKSAWLARHSFADTLILGIVMGLIVGVIGVVVGVAGILLTIPGALVLVWGVTSGVLAIEIVGVLLSVVLGGGAFLLGAGFNGSLVQVAYALACRDLCQHHGLPLAGTASTAAAA
jgi:hypothetical protein